MVHDDILTTAEPQTVAIISTRVPMAKSQVTKNNIMRCCGGSLIGQANSIARSGLARNGDVRLANSQPVLQVNRAGDGKDDDSRFLGSDCFAEAALDRRGFAAIVLQ